MTAGKRDERVFLADLRDAIDRILQYTSPGREAFFADPMMQDAVVRNIEIMGQAAKGVSDETRSRHPEVPWSKITGTRNRVIHGYFRVDLEIIWEIVEKELPNLKTSVAGLLSH